MARERTIPSAATHIQDFGLNVTPEPAVRNKRVVIIGTAEDGPMYTPIQINKPEDGEFIWGRNGAGDLVRGLFECWDAQDGTPTVVGVRIGNGVQASLEINESTGAGDNQEQSAVTTALKLEAIDPGNVYNQITIGYNDNRDISIYNPRTTLSTIITVDTEHPNNPNVDVHNVDELVNVINNDRNLSSILTASYEPLQADYEIAINSSSTGVVQNNASKVEISLEDILTNGYVTTDGFIISDPVGTGVTASNNLLALDTVEAVSISEWQNLENKGVVTKKLDIFPLDGKGTSKWDTIQALKDYDNDNQWMNDPSGVLVTSEYIYSLSNDQADSLPTESGGYYLGGSGTNTIRVTIPLCPDDSEETYGTNIASGYIMGLADAGEKYANYSGDWTQATTQGITAKTIEGIADPVRPSGLIKVYVSDDSDINGFWQELPYDNTSGVYMSSYDGTQAIFSIGPSGYLNSTGKMRALVDENNTILPDKYIRFTMNTVKDFLGEVETLPELEDAGTATLSTYFVRGDEILFNKAPDFDMVVNYGSRITYEPGSDVNISDTAEGYISFTNPDRLPGPGGASLDSRMSYIRLRYTYQPNFPAITSAAKSLTKGTNGNDLTPATRKAELEIALDALKNYEADLWVPMNAYIDSVSTRYNPITGKKEEIPIGYTDIFTEFLDDMSINGIQPHAVFGVEPMASVTQANKDEWVDRATVADLDDPNRASNIMNLIQDKFMSVVAFEPIFLNVGRGRPYTANGQAAYAGTLASIKYDISPTNKNILNVSDVRFDLSTTQFERLNAMRYVTMMPRPGRNPVIVEDVTAAPAGSDFVNWSVFSITAEAANRVRAVAQEFIGQPNSIEIRSSLEQLISNALMSMDGLRAFDFSLTSSPNQQVLGVVEIDLILVPVFTIKKIRTTVKLRKQLTV